MDGDVRPHPVEIAVESVAARDLESRESDLPQEARCGELLLEAPDNARWLYVSGQVGVTPEGKIAEGAEAQIEQAWRNVLSVLEAAGMAPRDLVKVTTFLVNRADLPTARAVRDRMLQGAEPASTLIFVAGLASPEWQRLAILWTYDEAGAFADHVAPPYGCLPLPSRSPFTTLGPRVPLVAISPWAKRGYASHVVHDHRTSEEISGSARS